MPEIKFSKLPYVLFEGNKYFCEDIEAANALYEALKPAKLNLKPVKTTIHIKTCDDCKHCIYSAMVGNYCAHPKRSIDTNPLFSKSLTTPPSLCPLRHGYDY